MKTLFLPVLLLFSCISALIPLSISAAPPLPLHEVFQLSTTVKDPQTLITHVKIAPGYYLYRDRLYFTAIPTTSAQLSRPIFPAGSIKSFQFLGKMIVYHDQVSVTTPVLSYNQPDFMLKINYQGCSEQGYCYPPSEKVLPIHLGTFEETATRAPQNFVANNQGSQPLSYLHPWWTALSFVGFGLLISLTPCVLPMVPILSSMIIGQNNRNPWRCFSLSACYVFSMALTYALAGVLFGSMGGTLQAAFQQPWAIISFSLVFVVMAIALFDVYQFQLPEKWRSRLAAISHYPPKGQYVGAGIMGCLSVLILSPCVTPPLVVAIGYISQTGNALLGGVFLFAMGLGMGLPLLLIGTFGSQLLPKAGAWMGLIKNLLGFLLLAMALWMLSRILPTTAIMLLSAILMSAIAIYLGTLAIPSRTSQWILKGLGLGLLVYSIVTIVSALERDIDLLHPLSLSKNKNLPNPENSPTFIPIKTLADLQRQIVAAKGKLVLLDFYADWCVACREMDRSIFHNLQVQKQLTQYVLLRADVTTNDHLDKRLQQDLGVVGPPTILFFDQAHPAIPRQRMIGTLSASAFLQQLTQFSATKLPPNLREKIPQRKNP